MELTLEQRHWASRAKQGVPPSELSRLLIKQGGLCAISGVTLLFDRIERTPVKGGRGCHPLSPAIDHIDPGDSDGGFQVVCYALNDLKGHLPVECFRALKQTNAWLGLMRAQKRIQVIEKLSVGFFDLTHATSDNVTQNSCDLLSSFPERDERKKARETV